MCLVSRQLGFVISPKFSYYLVPRSTTSPLILSYESIQTSDVSRFFSFPSSFLLLLFFLFFSFSHHRPHWVIRAPFSPQDPLLPLATWQSTRITPTVSPTRHTAPRSSSPFNSTRIETRQKSNASHFGRLGFNRFQRPGERGPLIGIGAFERRAIERIWR